MRIFATKETFAPALRLAAERLFSAYDGRREGWRLPPEAGLTGIHFGSRAGVVGLEADGLRCCAKLFYDDRAFVKLRNRLGFSKARRACGRSRELERRNVPAPRPLGYAVDGRGGLAALFSEWVEDAERVDERVRRTGATPAFASALGRFVRAMHEAGTTHSDLSLRNLLVRNETDFLLLDWEDCRFFAGPAPETRRMEDLHHLHERALALAPEAARCAFLRAYSHEDEGTTKRRCERLAKMLRDRPSKYSAGTRASDRNE